MTEQNQQENIEGIVKRGYNKFKSFDKYSKYCLFFTACGTAFVGLGILYEHREIAQPRLEGMDTGCYVMAGFDYLMAAVSGAAYLRQKYSKNKEK